MTQTYEGVVHQTEAWPRTGRASRSARRHGLQALSVTWEGAARYKDLAVGPNISGMATQAQRPVPGTDRHELTCMPVIRCPNFAGLSADIAPDHLSTSAPSRPGTRWRYSTTSACAGPASATCSQTFGRPSTVRMVR